MKPENDIKSGKNMKSENHMKLRNSKSRKIFRMSGVLASVLAALLLFSGCGESAMVQKQVNSMGTIFTITAYGKKAEQGITGAEASILAVEQMSDPDLETSVCYKLNHAQGEQVNVSGQIAEMLLDAKDIYEKTEGAYDLTVYQLVKRWGFTDGRYYVPTADEIAAELACLCMDQVSITQFANSGSYAVTMPSYGQLSFASCARGCASKYAVDALKKNGVESAIISLSGNVQTLGNKPDGTQWSVGITDPLNPSGYLGVISVGETAVVTTGAYQEYMTGSTKYHHIFNTKTGYPTQNTLLSATVVCEDGTVADCLSTAMYALGYNKAISYWRQYGGFDMILITEDGEIVCTSGLLERFDIRNNNYTLKYVE